MGISNYLHFVIDYREIYLRSNILTFLVYCGERTCAYNKKGKCGNFKIGLNEQGMCMGYSPLIIPNIVSNDKNAPIETDSKINNPIGFSE